MEHRHLSLRPGLRTEVHSLVRSVAHYGLIIIAVLGFLISCCGFLFYRILFKPLVFGLILLAVLPLMVSSFRSAPYTGSRAG